MTGSQRFSVWSLVLQVYIEVKALEYIVFNTFRLLNMLFSFISLKEYKHWKIDLKQLIRNIYILFLENCLVLAHEPAYLKTFEQRLIDGAIHNLILSFY